MFRKISLSILLALAIINAPIFADAKSPKIVADVNGEAITSSELNNRISIILGSSGMPVTEESTAKVQGQALELLINETLQRQDAQARNIALTDKEKELAIKDLEQKNNLPDGGFKDFIVSKNVSYDAVLSQIYSSILWRKVIERTIRPRIIVADYEITERKQLNRNKPKSVKAAISEIIIPIEYGDANAAKEKAYSVYNEAKSADNFALLAKKYSAGKTAQNGGEVGVLDLDTMNPIMKEIVKKTPAQSVAEPKLIDNSFYTIIKVGDKKTFDLANDDKLVKEELTIEKIELETKRYIKELRSNHLLKNTSRH